MQATTNYLSCQDGNGLVAEALVYFQLLHYRHLPQIRPLNIVGWSTADLSERWI
jgi:hypothetical protein